MNKKQMIELFRLGVAAVNPEHLVREHIRLETGGLFVAGARVDTTRYPKIALFAAGKAALPMAREAKKILGALVDGGAVIAPKKEPISGLKVYESDHPIPTERTIKATKALLKNIQALTPEHYVIFLLSGGASSLMELPAKPLTLRDLNTTGHLLLEHALPIESINCIRKHLSAVKGGFLGRAIPTQGSVLVLSDVIGDKLGAIGSAPLYADTTTFDDALTIVKESGLARRLPEAVIKRLESGSSGAINETPKEPRSDLPHTVIGSNRIALEAIREAAKKQLDDVRIITDRLVGEASEQAKSIVQTAKTIASEGGDDVLLIYGGEPTVTVTGDGKGGRNQELALAAALSLEGTQNILLLSAGTDGIDGNSSAAGAVVDGMTVTQAKQKGLAPEALLHNNDSYRFHQAAKSLIATGYTGTNVMDIILVYIKRS